MGNIIASTTTSIMTTDRGGRAGHSRTKKEEKMWCSNHDKWTQKYKDSQERWQAHGI